MPPSRLPTCSSLTSAWPSDSAARSYALMTGDVAAVNAAVEAGSTAAASGLLVSKVVIPSPAETVFEQIA
ncbi:MAG: BMC domain-containing protein [Bilophila wadsworthia]